MNKKRRDVVLKMLSEGVTSRQVAKEVGVTLQWVYSIAQAEKVRVQRRGLSKRQYMLLVSMGLVDQEGNLASDGDVLAKILSGEIEKHFGKGLGRKGLQELMDLYVTDESVGNFLSSAVDADGAKEALFRLRSLLCAKKEAPSTDVKWKGNRGVPVRSIAPLSHIVTVCGKRCRSLGALLRAIATGDQVITRSIDRIRAAVEKQGSPIGPCVIDRMALVACADAIEEIQAAAAAVDPKVEDARGEVNRIVSIMESMGMEMSSESLREMSRATGFTGFAILKMLKHHTPASGRFIFFALEFLDKKKKAMSMGEECE